MRRRQYTNTPTTNRQQLEGTTTNPFDSWPAGVHRTSVRATLGRSRHSPLRVERLYITNGFALYPVRWCCLPNEIRRGIVHS